MKRKTKSILVSDLLRELDHLFPQSLAESWDNVGLVAGDLTSKVTGIVVAINLGPEALKKAAESKSNVIVCHHPPIFKPIQKLTSKKHPYVLEALRRKISILAFHTNYDVCSGQTNKAIAQKLGLEYKECLVKKSEQLLKFVTFVPPNALEKVSQAVFEAGAGHIGHYSHCSFQTLGHGTFMGDGGSNPAIGKPGKFERTQEVRFESIASKSIAEKVVRAAQNAHPYEEMAYDLYDLQVPTKRLGYGFIAEIKSKAFNFPKLVESVKKAFQLKTVQVAGSHAENPKLPIRRIGFSPGAGSSFVSAACASNLDVYICGEVSYHQILEARQNGLTLILLGHSYSEFFFMDTFKSELKSLCRRVSGASEYASKIHCVYEKIEVSF